MQSIYSRIKKTSKLQVSEKTVDFTLNESKNEKETIDFSKNLEICPQFIYQTEEKNKNFLNLKKNDLQRKIDGTSSEIKQTNLLENIDKEEKY